MSTIVCPTCNSENVSHQLCYINNETGEKIVLGTEKSTSTFLGIFTLILGIGFTLVGLWLIPAIFTLSRFEGLWALLIGVGLTLRGGNTVRSNLQYQKMERRIEYTCNYCKTIWKDDGVILESHKPEISPTSAPSEKAPTAEISPNPTIPEKTEKVGETKLCPRCHMESNAFYICKECGYIDKIAGSVLSILAIVGLAVGIHGLLAWIAGKNTLWVEIVKTLLCGFPGALFVYWGVIELVHIGKSKKWAERHNHEMNELLAFYKNNPNANFDEAGKFLNHTGQWVELMLSESKSKKE
jgi:hypothetical protein